MPQLEEGNLWIRALLPRTVSLEGRRADGPPAPRGDRLDPRDQERDVARRPPDDGTDVTSFFNLEFNAPLKPMEQWRPGSP